VKQAERTPVPAPDAIGASDAPQPTQMVPEVSIPLPSTGADPRNVSDSTELSQFHAWQLPAESLPPPALAPDPGAETAPLPDSMLRVQKCASCGFPVSEGRTLCLDCETKKDYKIEQARDVSEPVTPQPAESVALATDETLPPFLANAAPVKESWLSDHVNLLVILVLILGVLVAVVLFR
jgi:hypothetical protein